MLFVSLLIYEMVGGRKAAQGRVGVKFVLSEPLSLAHYQLRY